MYSQAMALGEYDQALLMRLRELTPKELTTEEERRDFFMNGVMPKAWGEVQIEYTETVVPDDHHAHLNQRILVGRYERPAVVTERFDDLMDMGFKRTHQGLQHPTIGQADLAVPTRPGPYIAHARRVLEGEPVPTRRVFQMPDGQYFLLWELMRSPDMPSDAPLVTEIVLLLPACLGALAAKEMKHRRLPPTVETFAYHQIFVMIERLYAEWSNQDELIQEIAMNVLTLRELEQRGLPRAFHMAHQLEVA